MLRLPRFTPGVPRIDPPRIEGTIPMPRGGCLGFAEFGVPDGRLVLWFHGTPGGRRQIPPVGRVAAEALGLRLVCVERPGVGDSTPHRYRRFIDVAPDAAAVADHLGHDQFAVVGLSGGGPYALAAAAGNPDRVPAVGILGGVCPVAGPDKVPGGGIVALAARFRAVLGPLRAPLGLLLWATIQPLVPLSHPAYRLYASRAPQGDRKVFDDPGIEAMFVDDLVTASRRRFGAIPDDIALFGRDWGFRLAEVTAPVRWWHGDADNLVPLSHAEHTIDRLPDCVLHLRPGESHLGGFAAADEVLTAVAALWPGVSGNGRRASGRGR